MDQSKQRKSGVVIAIWSGISISLNICFQIHYFSTKIISFKMNADEDRISRLPDRLLHEVYSSLETVYYVQASVLSKRWKNLWKSTPNIYFSGVKCGKSSAVYFADGVLDQRDRLDICTFRLSGYFDIIHMKRYICYAVAHKVQVLDLSKSVVPVCFPKCFFTSESIQLLECGVWRDTLPPLTGLVALKSLHIYSCYLTKDTFDEKHSSSCPNLETLVLNGVSTGLPVISICGHKLKYLEVSIFIHSGNSYVLNVSAPRLVTFKYETGYPSILSMGNIPLIEEVYVYFEKLTFPVRPGISKNESALKFIKILMELSNAKSLTLSMSTLEAVRLEPIGLLEKHPSPFCNLRHLTLKCDEHARRHGTRIVLPTQVLYFLLKNSPSAMTTTIVFFSEMTAAGTRRSVLDSKYEKSLQINNAMVSLF